jgi:hypothetical protein|nr:MAG TPA: YopX protein [Caudoviricetes sp.]
MRPRYRAWDKEQEKMYYDVERIYDDWKTSCASFGAMLEDTERFDVMQYTGKKDINSRRIFEKDIVSFCTLNGTERIGRVKYYEDGASFLIIAEGRYAEYLNNVSDLEVLGNIYQNKELLNETTKI